MWSAFETLRLLFTDLGLSSEEAERKATTVLWQYERLRKKAEEDVDTRYDFARDPQKAAELIAHLHADLFCWIGDPMHNALGTLASVG